MIEQVIYGIITGFVYSLSGWQKDVAQRTKVFDTVNFKWLKLFKSIVICGVVGGFAGYSNADFNILIVGGFGIAVTNVFNIAWKILGNKIINYFKRWKFY